MSRCIVSLVTAPLLLVLAGPARAQSAPASQSVKQQRAAREAARRHYDSGAKFYAAGDYESARAEFEEAYRLAPMPDMLFNLARVCEKLDRGEEAAVYLERYLRERPDAPDANAVRSRIEALRQQLAPKVEPREAPPPPAVTPPPPAVTPPPPAVTPPPREGPVLWPGLVLIGGGAALLAVGAGLGGAALAAARQVGDPGNSGRYFDAELQALQSRGQTLSTTAVALDIVGGVAVAGGVAWSTYCLHRRRKGDRVHVSAAPGPAAGITLTGSF